MYLNIKIAEKHKMIDDNDTHLFMFCSGSHLRSPSGGECHRGAVLIAFQFGGDHARCIEFRTQHKNVSHCIKYEINYVKNNLNIKIMFHNKQEHVQFR